MKFLKQHFILLSVILAFCASGLLAGGSSKPKKSPIDTFQNTWEHRSLAFQRTLDKYLPMARATFLATHNTYNSKVYSKWYLFTYLDPNHKYSIKDQLRMDLRQIELDVHWYNGKLRLCHGQGNHMGCNISDKPFSDGVSEVNSFIRSNRSEVVIIYIENHMDNKYSKAISTLSSYMGDLIYRPSGGCKNVPLNLSKQDILNAGKNIIIFNSTCGSGGWSNWAFTRGNITESNVSSFKAAPNCGRSRSDYNNKWVRFYEDRTKLSEWFGGGSGKINTTNMRQMMECGVNLPGLDMADPYDGRLKAAVWSWNTNEPNNYRNREDCVHTYAGSGRWNDAYCGNWNNFACTNGSSWKVTNARGPWSWGQSKCRNEFGSSYNFATPLTGYQNKLLKDASSGKSRVWLKINDRSREGKFIP